MKFWMDIWWWSWRFWWTIKTRHLERSRSRIDLWPRQRQNGKKTNTVENTQIQRQIQNATYKIQICLLKERWKSRKLKNRTTFFKIVDFLHFVFCNLYFVFCICMLYLYFVFVFVFVYFWPFLSVFHFAFASVAGRAWSGYFLTAALLLTTRIVIIIIKCPFKIS